MQMEAKIITIGDTQLVEIPAQYRFENSGEVVFINKIGNLLMIAPADKVGEIMYEGAKGVSEDFMQEEYPDEYFQKRG